MKRSLNWDGRKGRPSSVSRRRAFKEHNRSLGNALLSAFITRGAKLSPYQRVVLGLDGGAR